MGIQISIHIGGNMDGTCRGARDVVWRQRRLSVVPPGVRCCVLGRVFGFNHKIMINV
jgi:hypothetical protein